MKTLHDRAVEIEKYACRNQWLVVTQLLGDISPYEQDEALQMILDESQRITRTQYDQVKSIIDTGEFTTLAPL